MSMYNNLLKYWRKSRCDMLTPIYDYPTSGSLATSYAPVMCRRMALAHVMAGVRVRMRRFVAGRHPSHSI